MVKIEIATWHEHFEKHNEQCIDSTKNVKEKFYIDI